MPRDHLLRHYLLRDYLHHMVPILISQLLQMLTVTISNLFIGRLLGANALAAASLLFPLQFFFTAFVIGIGTGASVLIAQSYGAGDRRRMNTIMINTLWIATIFGAMVGVIGIYHSEKILALIGAPLALKAEASAYADVVFAGAAIQFIFIVYTAALRAVADRATPALAYGLSAAITAIATPALVAPLSYLPRLGVAGSALAIQIATALALLWMLWRVRRNDGLLRIDRAMLTAGLDRKLVATILRIGIPSGLQLVVMAIAEMVLLGLVNRHGSVATAAYAVVMQVLTYVQLPTMAIAVAATLLAAQAIGAGRVAVIANIVRLGMVLNFAVTGPLVAIAVWLSPMLVAQFVADTTVNINAQHMLGAALWGAVPLGMAGVLAGVMRASGEVMAPTLLTMSAIVAVEVPVAWLLSEPLGLRGIALSYPIAFAAMLILQALYFHCIWRKRTLRPIM